VLTVKPRARTTASAALSPSAEALVPPDSVLPVPWWVNAGAGAVRVVLGLDVPLLSLGVVVVLVGVVAVLVVVLVRGAAVEVVCSGNGVLATVTVFVPPPQPASSAASARLRRGIGVFRRLRFIAFMIFAARCAPPRLGSSPRVSPLLDLQGP
jgi:hypothetical protein